MPSSGRATPVPPPHAPPTSRLSVAAEAPSLRLFATERLLGRRVMLSAAQSPPPAPTGSALSLSDLASVT